MNTTIKPDILTITTEEQDGFLIRITPTGDIFWKGREVVSDEDFKLSMLDLAANLCK